MSILGSLFTGFFWFFVTALAVGLLGNIIVYFSDLYLYKKWQQEQDVFIRGSFDRLENEESKSRQEQYYKPKTLLTPEQVEQLNICRAKVSIDYAKQFPKIRISGNSMPNLVPDAGIFTAKINHEGKIINLIVMLSTINAVSEFQRLCSVYRTIENFFWAEGYLLPSREGICYSVYLVTAFRFCGKKIYF